MVYYNDIDVKEALELQQLVHIVAEYLPLRRERDWTDIRLFANFQSIIDNR